MDESHTSSCKLFSKHGFSNVLGCVVSGLQVKYTFILSLPIDFGALGDDETELVMGID